MRISSNMLVLVRRGFSNKVPQAAATEVNADSRDEDALAEPGKSRLEEAVVKKLPYYRKIHLHHQPQHMLQEEFPERKNQWGDRRPAFVENEGDLSGAAARLFDYKRTGELAARLSNIAERIDFVSPYERPWTRAEKTWRRDWHPSLLATRKAWAVPPIPAYFNPLHFYQYITKTRIEQASLDEVYKGIVLPYATFNKLLEESLQCNLESSRFDLEEERVSACLAACLDDAITALSHARAEKIDKLRVAYDTQYESFWIRGGFMFLYDVLEEGKREPCRKLWNYPKYTGDDRRKLGELAFVHRARVSAALRSTQALPFALLADKDSREVRGGIFSEDESNPEIHLLPPRVFNLWPDEDPLWQSPGFRVESDETHRFTRLAFQSLCGLQDRIATHWRMQEAEASETLAECGVAQAVVSLYSILCATAHVEGFTQYNDISLPYSTQLILSDGKVFFFAVGQLNTLATNIEVDGFENPLVNLARVEGPHKLYDKYENGAFYHLEEGAMVQGLNKRVLQRILQMVYFHT